MAREQNGLEQAEKTLSSEEWQELSDQLWKDFRASVEWSSGSDERAKRTKIVQAIAAIQPLKPEGM